MMVIGVIECFAGYRGWRFLLGVNGAVFGSVAGAMLCMLLGAPIMILIGLLGGGVAGAALFAGIAPLGSFVFAFVSMFSLTIFLAHIAAAPPHLIMPLAVAGGLACAVAALAACRPFMIAIAAVAGAQQISSAWRAHHLPRGALPLPDLVTPSETALFIALAAAGLLVQFVQKPIISKTSVPKESLDQPQSAISLPRVHS
jgi:hypothetical protein